MKTSTKSILVAGVVALVLGLGLFAWATGHGPKVTSEPLACTQTAEQVICVDLTGGLPLHCHPFDGNLTVCSAYLAN